MRAPEAILLDLDGTLVDSKPGIVASYDAALRDLSHVPDPGTAGHLGHPEAQSTGAVRKAVALRWKQLLR